MFTGASAATPDKYQYLTSVEKQEMLDTLMKCPEGFAEWEAAQVLIRKDIEAFLEQMKQKSDAVLRGIHHSYVTGRQAEAEARAKQQMATWVQTSEQQRQAQLALAQQAEMQKMQALFQMFQAQVQPNLMHPHVGNGQPPSGYPVQYPSQPAAQFVAQQGAQFASYPGAQFVSQPMYPAPQMMPQQAPASPQTSTPSSTPAPTVINASATNH